MSNTTPYGQACSQCAKAKAKCNPRGIGSPCERCLRLHKQCQRIQSVRSKPGRRREAGPTSPSRTDLLEARLNRILTVLASSGMADRIAAANIAGNDTEADVSRASSGQAPTVAAVFTPMTRDDASFSDASDRRADSEQGHDDEGRKAFAELDADGDVALLRFRTERLASFPVVHIPATTTAAQLRQTRPTLWLAILACTARATASQQAVAALLRRWLAAALVERHERSLDLLQALLVYLGWSMYFLQREPFMLLYGHMVVAVMQDLGLDMPPWRVARPGAGMCGDIEEHITTGAGVASGAGALQTPATSTSGAASAATTTSPNPPTGIDRDMSLPTQPSAQDHPFACERPSGCVPRLSGPFLTRTVEDCRTALGSFLISILISLFHRKPIALRWSDQLEECLRVLDAAHETPLDRLLAYQVRLQCIAVDVPCPNIFASLMMAGAAEQMRQIRGAHMTALLARHRDVVRQFADLPDDLRTHGHMARLANEAIIYSVALYAGADGPNTAPDTARAELLAHAMHAYLAWYDIVRQQPPATYAALWSFPSLVQVALFLFGIYRIASLGSPPTPQDDTSPNDDAILPPWSWDRLWDRDMARAQLRVPDRLDELAARFADARVGCGFEPVDQANPDFFTRTSRILQSVRASWIAGWAKEDEQASARHHQQQQMHHTQQTQQSQQSKQSQQKQQTQQTQPPASSPGLGLEPGFIPSGPPAGSSSPPSGMLSGGTIPALPVDNDGTDLVGGINAASDEFWVPDLNVWMNDLIAYDGNAYTYT